MARQYYNITGTNPVAGDQNPATALTRLRNLEAVDRYTGVNLVDPGATISYTNPGSAQVDITFASGGLNLTATHLITQPGNYVFYNKTLVLTVDGAIRAGADGVHLYFVNCTIAQDAASGTNPRISTQQATNGGTTDSRVTNGAAVGRSVNFYGCTISGPQAIQNSTFYISDIFNSTYISYQGRRTVLAFAALGGSRAINLTVAGPSDDVVGVVTTYYGAPELFEGFAGSFSQLEAAATFGQNQAILIEPNFTSLEAGQRYRMQQDDVANRAFQVIGPYNPPVNVNDDTVTSTDGTPYVWYAAPGGGATESTAGGVINYYGWQSGFFSDLAQTQGIQGINVRVESNATLNNTTLNGATSGTYSTAISNQSESTVDLTGGALTQITEHKTGTTGFPVVGATSQSSVNGTTFTAGQWIDWLRLGVFNLDGYTTNPTTEVAQNFLGQAAPDGCVIAPISLVRNDTYNQFAARYQARGFTHQIINVDSQNGLLGTAAGNQTANAVTPIDTTNYIGSSIVGVSVKSQNVLNGQPNMVFPANATVSVNDIRDAYRAGWWAYGYDIANGDHLTPEINLQVNNGLSTDFAAIATNIEVRANGIALDGTNDLFTSSTFGNGQFNGGSLSGHDLTFTGVVQSLGNVTNATISATSIGLSDASVSSDSTFVGNITNARSTSFAENNTFGNQTISFTGLTLNQVYSPDELLGGFFDITDGSTVTLISDVAIQVESTRSDIAGGSGVQTVLPSATVDFSALIAAESNFFSATPTTARAYWALTSDYDNTSDQIVTGELTNGIFTIPGLTAGQEVAVAVSKPGRVNFRQVFTFAGGEVITPVLNSIDAVNESTDITGVVVNGGREAGGLIIFGLSGAPTSNSLDGPQTVWMTELMKGKARYCVGLLEGLNMTIEHTSTVSSAWDETVFVMEPITTNQQVLGIASSTVGNPNPVQDNGTLSIFINGATEVNYGTIDNLLDDNLTPITGELTAITNHVNEVEGNQTIITTNQSVLLTATQRGALKAATYSAGSITPATDNS